MREKPTKTTIRKLYQISQSEEVLEKLKILMEFFSTICFMCVLI